MWNSGCSITCFGLNVHVLLWGSKCSTSVTTNWDSCPDTASQSAVQCLNQRFHAWPQVLILVFSLRCEHCKVSGVVLILSVSYFVCFSPLSCSGFRSFQSVRKLQFQTSDCLAFQNKVHHWEVCQCGPIDAHWVLGSPGSSWISLLIALYTCLTSVELLWHYVSVYPLLQRCPSHCSGS